MAHPELDLEQAKVDYFYETAEAELGERADSSPAEAAADRYSARIAKQEDSDRITALAAAVQRNICVGRMETKSSAQPIYVGRVPLWDEREQLLLVSAMAKAAKPFFVATAKKPLGVVRRRRFTMTGRTLSSIGEDVWGELTEPEAIEQAEPSYDDALLEELGADRGPEMRDIVATIRADQYEIASAPLEETLVVQGGPGTGKTAIGLHRVAYLLFNHRDELTRDGVLLVGPNTTFMDYVAEVLPSLGETHVDQVSVGLLTSLRPRRDDEPSVERLKGDARMASVLASELSRRISVPSEPISFEVERRAYEVTTNDVAALIDELKGRGAYMPARSRFRDRLLDLAVAAVVGKRSRATDADTSTTRDSLRSNIELQNALERTWPTMTGPRLVHELLTGPRRLGLAGEGKLTPDEQRLLRRPNTPLGQAAWTTADVPLVHEAEHLVNGTVDRYGLVIVDEAQDLAPMQVRMLGRRASRSITLLGDLAQATGPHEWSSWENLIAELPGKRAVTHLELSLSYRVPAEVLEFASPVLRAHPAGGAPPRAIRDTGTSPAILEVDSLADLLDRAVSEAAGNSGSSGTVGIIAPAELHEGMRQSARRLGVELFDVRRDGLGDRISLMEPRLAKGLEFDHVVVAEPAAFLDGSPQGLACLYVALTRPTRTLCVLHRRPLPATLGGPTEEPEPTPEERRLPPEIALADALGICQVLLVGVQHGDQLMADGLVAAASEIRGGSQNHAGRALIARVLDGVDDDLALAIRRKLESS